MKVQIFEQFHGGHYTTYIQHLLEPLIAQEHEVVVTITSAHANSSAFKEQLKPYSQHVRFDTSLPAVNSTIALNPKFVVQHPVIGVRSLSRLYQLQKNMVKAVWREQPDCFIATTSDLQNMFLSLLRRIQPAAFPRHTRTLGILHYGYAGSEKTLSDWAKSRIYQTLWQQSPFDHLLLVNPVVYEWMMAHDSALRSRITLVPDPVSPLQPFEQAIARKVLELPPADRYVGFIGAMDHRVAIPELITAFRQVALSSEKLLLAGKLLAQHRTYINNYHSDLIHKKQLILRDRHLSYGELSAGYQALNLVTPLYYKKPNLSANLLKALLANTPVLASDFGYTGMMIRRFGLGWSCDVNDPVEVAEKMRQGLNSQMNTSGTNKNVDYNRPEIVKLKQFHSPQNYAATVLATMHKQPPVAAQDKNRTWQWVNS